MRATYEEITNRMRNAFFEACGEQTEQFPELDARFRSVATEVYALSAFGDQVQRQVFADTAEGEELDRHAQDVGLQRKAASPAEGELLFSVADISNTPVTIPADTVCSVEGQPFLQFATTQAATIGMDGASVQVPAVSLGKTAAHNVETGKITVMVNPPAGVARVTNMQPFRGGAAPETDVALRKRICRLQQVPPNGVNTACLAAAVEQLEQVLSCKVCHGGADRLVQVYVHSRQGQMDDALRRAITEKLDILTLAGCRLEIKEAKRKVVHLLCSAQILAGADPQHIEAAIKRQLKNLGSARVIGGSLHPSELAAKLKVEGLCGTPEVHAAGEYGGSLPCSSDTYLEVKTVQVTCYV